MANNRDEDSLINEQCTNLACNDHVRIAVRVDVHLLSLVVNLTQISAEPFCL